MKKLYIFKVGSTFAGTRQKLGDFEQWTAAVLSAVDSAVDIELGVIQVEQGEALPPPAQCAGVVITGSHAMVTDKLPWSVKLEAWLRQAVAAGVPILGVCYGHQLLAEAMGGEVGYHPQGKEIGTVAIQTEAGSVDDPLFQKLPPSFMAQATHSQSVLRLPANAVHLAGNAYEPNHAYRIGRCAWGVQFHPEYTAQIMREYIEQQADKLTSAGREVPGLLNAVTEAPEATRILVNFARYVSESGSDPDLT